MANECIQRKIDQLLSLTSKKRRSSSPEMGLTGIRIAGGQDLGLGSATPGRRRHS